MLVRRRPPPDRTGSRGSAGRALGCERERKANKRGRERRGARWRAERSRAIAVAAGDSRARPHRRPVSDGAAVRSGACAVFFSVARRVPAPVTRDGRRVWVEGSIRAKTAGRPSMMDGKGTTFGWKTHRPTAHRLVGARTSQQTFATVTFFVYRC